MELSFMNSLSLNILWRIFSFVFMWSYVNEKVKYSLYFSNIKVCKWCSYLLLHSKPPQTQWHKIVTTLILPTVSVDHELMRGRMGLDCVFSEMAETSSGKNWISGSNLEDWKLFIHMLGTSVVWVKYWALVGLLTGLSIMAFPWQLNSKKEKSKKNNLKSEHYKRTK